MTKLVIISDTHTLHDGISLPSGDILLHCGDFTMRGTEKEYIKFNTWLGKLHFKHIVVIPGNHDFLSEENTSLARSLITNAQMLIHESTKVEGLNIFGSPWTPWFHDWAFNYNADQAHSLWGQIPYGTDVVMTHGPVHGLLDLVLREPRQHVGCPVLGRILTHIKPKVHACGHIHEGYGTMTDYSGLLHVNASLLDHRYDVKNPPIEIEL